jgi:DNA-binding HxlR family transcriptional regulator
VNGGYGQFCPVSKAAEVLCERWTPLIIRELMVGSTRFNDIRRGLPTCSTSLLSQRLKRLERAGVVKRSTGEGLVSYSLTPAGWELFPLVQGLGEWGQRWARSEYRDEELDPGMLLWDVRRYLTASLGDSAIMFTFPNAPAKKRRYWVVISHGEVDLCLTDPGQEISATIEADLRALTRVWMGDITFRDAVRDGQVLIQAPTVLARKIPDWFGQHPVLAEVQAAVE